MKKLIVTGCNGQLGRAINRVFEGSREYELVNTDVGELDITNVDEVLRLAWEVKPWAIINCAAHTAVDLCETDVDNAYRYLIATRLVDPPYDFGILPALPGCSSMKSPERMLEGLMRINGLIQEAAPGAHVLTCCAGRASSYLAAASMLLGMSVRVGMEDTPWMWPHKDELITSNAKMFQMFRDMAHMLGREIYTPEEYRQTMKIGRA